MASIMWWGSKATKERNHGNSTCLPQHFVCFFVVCYRCVACVCLSASVPVYIRDAKEALPHTHNDVTQQPHIHVPSFHPLCVLTFPFLGMHRASCCADMFVYII